MKTYVAIDDTDSITEGSTGESANQIIKLILDNHWGSCQGLTRHQLLLHPDIAYTSHNSAMCFIADLEEECTERLIKETGAYLEQYSSPGSDPGFCLAVEEQIRDKESLISFGYEAKKRIMTKEEAYELAGRLGVHLSEHGGTGLGVIGALAGVGLRMTNNDGRFQGKMELKAPGTTLSVREILRNSSTEKIQSLDGYVLGDDDEVRLGKKLKNVLLNGKRVLLVYHPEKDNLMWETCTNAQLEMY